MMKSAPVPMSGIRKAVSFPDSNTGQSLRSTAPSVGNKMETTYTGPTPKIGKWSCFFIVCSRFLLLVYANIIFLILFHFNRISK